MTLLITVQYLMCWTPLTTIFHLSDLINAKTILKINKLYSTSEHFNVKWFSPPSGKWHNIFPPTQGYYLSFSSYASFLIWNKLFLVITIDVCEAPNCFLDAYFIDNYHIFGNIWTTAISSKHQLVLLLFSDRIIDVKLSRMSPRKFI